MRISLRTGAENWTVRNGVAQEGGDPVFGGVSTYLDLVVVSAVFVTSTPGEYWMGNQPSRLGPSGAGRRFGGHAFVVEIR